MDPVQKELIDLAHSLGASEAKFLSPLDIDIDDSLAAICNTSQCDNYGLAPSCPPHVSGPQGFRRRQNAATYGLVFRIIVPQRTLFSSERREVMRLLHEISAAVELRAIALGYVDSQGFAGGSCKELFCNDRKECIVLEENGECRHPMGARHSMSGYGINVSSLMKACGWPADITPWDGSADSEAMSWVAGLVLIG